MFYDKYTQMDIYGASRVFGDNQIKVVMFMDSDEKEREIRRINEQQLRSAYNGLKAAVKSLHANDVQVVMRDGHVYLVKEI